MCFKMGPGIQPGSSAPPRSFVSFSDDPVCGPFVLAHTAVAAQVQSWVLNESVIAPRENAIFSDSHSKLSLVESSP